MNLIAWIKIGIAVVTLGAVLIIYDEIRSIAGMLQEILENEREEEDA